jgi:serine/threonine-protein kinase
MSLSSGSRLGAYEIISSLGAGGMGEVYRARDTKLGREVALKILPASFTNDPERVARFRREAHVLASLNHPHIGAIYGLNEANGTEFLVLELVDGESLDKRIARGAIPVDEALSIAKQIAEALEAAHEKGIIHRDLKPANIALTRDGQVKVLDLGLAKAIDPTAPASDLSISPTITSPAMMTGVGVILGTAAYMSPEQAKGRAADKRSDIWAFGCVLYEVLTGKRAFDGDDVSDTLAAVLRGEPDWSMLPQEVPAHILLLLRRCLEKDRRARVADVSIARFLVTEPITATAAVPPPAPVQPPKSVDRWTRARWAAAAAIASAALTSAAFWRLWPSPAPQPVTRFVYTLGTGQVFTGASRQVLAMSEDGTQMAYVANGGLYLKSTKELNARPIQGMERQGTASMVNPVFSPDGGWLAFWSFADSTLKKIPTSGGVPVTLCKADPPFGMSWDGNTIFFGQGNKGIMRVSENGGRPETVIRVKDGEVAHGPQLLPDQRTLLYTVAEGLDPEQWDRAQVVVQRLGSPERQTIISGGADARYLPTGHIVYAVAGALFAIPFDMRHLEVTGGSVAIVEGIARASIGQTGTAQYAVSRTGSLMYVPGPATALAQLDLALLDRHGTVERLKLPPRPYQVPRFSRDGGQVAVGIDDGREANIWVYEVSGESAIRQLTFGGKNRFPVWTADGTRIAFQSDREKDLGIFWQRADGTGTAERLTKPDQNHAHIPLALSPKGNGFLFGDIDGSSVALWTFSTSDNKTAPFDAVRSSYPSSYSLQATFSPDEEWLAYSSDETENRTQAVFVQPFPATGIKYKIANGVGPMWAPNARELFFSTGDPSQPFFVVSVSTQPTFRFGDPKAVPRPGAINAAGLPRNYDLAPDGQHFVIVVDASQTTIGSAPQIQAVINWFEELKRLVPTK